MFEQDYLMRTIMQLVDAITRSMQKATGEQDPVSSAKALDDAISTATELDGSVLLSLAPESIASILSVSGTDPSVVEYVSRSMLLSSQYWQQAGDAELASIRAAQAHGLASAYGFSIETHASPEESMQAFLDQQKQ